MKKLHKKFLSLLAGLAIGFVSVSLVSCGSDVGGDDEKIDTVKKGTVQGKVVYQNVQDDFSGITVSLVPTDGVLSADLCANALVRSVLPQARNIASANFVQTQTSKDGSYSFTDVEPGIYTIYASLSNSTEKAVSTNIMVRSAESVTAQTLKLTATGNVSGYVTFDSQSSGNLGTIVFVAGTGYLALTDDSGAFEISGIPAGKEYQLVVMKGNYVTSWKKVTINASETVFAGLKNLLSVEINSNQNALVWKGNYENEDSLTNPETGWAYYNLTDGCSYIYDGTHWTILAKSGAAGKDGIDGTNGKDGIDGANGKSITWKGELAEAPDSPELYWAYYNTADGNSYIYNGTEWNLLSKAGANGKDGKDGVDGKDGSNGKDGENGTDGKDGTNDSNTVVIIWKGELPEAPASPELYWAYYNTADGCSYIYNGTEWNLLAKAGANGKDGVDGKDGKNGKDGVDGKDGTNGSNTALIIWKGELDEAPVTAELYWAYYNSTDGCSYIYNGSSWNLLAKAGANGKDGVDGKDGKNGKDGLDGKDGTNSKDGVDGKDGTNGTNGTDGVNGLSISWKGELEEAPASPELYWGYYNTVDGCSYIYDGTEWNLLVKAGKKGDKGKDGLSLTWKGAFDSAPSNPELYWAYYNITDGCSYIYNGTIWQVLAQGSVEIIWKGCLDAEPSEPQANWAYYDNNFHATFVYDGLKWNRLPEPVNLNTKIEWLGELNSVPENPQPYNAYLNTNSGISYIYINNEWQILAKPGASGLNGETAEFVSVDNFAAYLEAQVGSGPFVIALEGELIAGRIPEIKTALNKDKNKMVHLDLTQVTGLTGIPQEAFISCTALEAIALPNTVTVIGNSAFYGCSKLKNVKLGSGVTAIGEKAFYSNKVLESINLPQNLKSIGKLAFCDCSKILQIIIPGNTVSIGDYAFAGTGISSITIPASIKTVGNGVFGYSSNSKFCTSLTNVIIESGPTYLSEEMFRGCTNLSSVTIPDSVKNIGKSAFYGCMTLASIELPDSITTINDSAFYNCSTLSSVIIPDSVKSIGSSVFESCKVLTTISIPDSVESLGTGVFRDCTSLTSVSLPDIPSAINSYMFYGCTSLSSISIPASVTTIADSAFYNTGFTDFNIPFGITSIGNEAFSYCKKLSSVAIPNTVTMIGNNAFHSTALLKVSIPDSVTIIGDSAFSHCDNLASVSFGENVVNIGGSCFSGCTSLATVTLPEKLTLIADSMFSGCISLSSVELGMYITSIRSNAFTGCSTLSTVTIPDSVTTIGSSAFSKSGLKEIKFGKNVATIDYYAFGFCKSLETVVIPPKVTVISGYNASQYGVFEGCTALKTVVLHEKITSIESLAFNGCTSLSSIVIPKSVTTMGGSVFSNCTGLLNIYVKGISAQPTGWSSSWKGNSTATVTWNYTE